MSAHRWAEFREGYRLHLLATGHSRPTIGGYLYTLGKFERWCEAHGTTAHKVNQLQLHRWIATRLEDWSLTTNQRSISALRSFYRWLKAAHRRRDDPTEGLKLRPVRPIPHRPYTPAQLIALLVATGNDLRRAVRDRAMLLILMDTGIRVGELAAMQIEDIDWEEAVVKVHGKGAKERWIAPGETAMGALRDHVNGQRGFVWGIKIAAIEAMIHRRARDAGLGRVHPHGFRHTFAITFLEQSRDLDALRVILGHETLKQAADYATYNVRERALDQQRRFSLADRLSSSQGC